jgi:signal transduction histidine kinase
MGISEDKLAAVFEPFVQLNRTKTSGNEGTGLGLSISRDLARAMGGELSVRSKPGDGSTFTLRLPRVATQHSQKSNS